MESPEMVDVQMLDLPADVEGLRWIVSQDPTRLLLIPGLLPASVAAAAAGDQQALAHLRSTAERHAADPHAYPLSPLDRVCIEASEIRTEEGYGEFYEALEKKRPRLYKHTSTSGDTTQHERIQ